MSAPSWTADIHVGTLGDSNPRLGRIVRTADGSEFTFLKGVASLAAGDFVVYYSDNTSARMVNTPLPGRVGVSMSANTTSANQSWFQISGLTDATVTNIATSSGADKLPLYESSSAGRATTTPAAAVAVYGAFAVGAAASNVGQAWLQRPFAVGASTL